MPEDTKWDCQLVKDLHNLNSLGMRKVEDLLVRHRDQVLVKPVQDLKFMATSKRMVKAKHHKAYNRVLQG